MKIGIITFHRALNYGGVLQCFALYEYLRTKGHDVFIIDYRPWFIEKYRTFFSWKELRSKSGFSGIVKYVIKKVLNRKGQLKASKIFDSFLERFHFTSIIRTVDDISQDFNLIIIGSDQIWNPTICCGFDDVYWGQLGHKQVPIVSYAASIGETDKFDIENWKIIQAKLRNLNKISVRESSFCQELEDKCSISSRWVLDPTLLNSTVFDKIIVKPKETNYLLLFTVQHEENAYIAAKNLAKKLNCIIIHISAIEYKVGRKIDEKVKQVFSVSPGEFCGYIKYATFVLTNSFHATAFSINFNKDFYVMRCPAQVRMNSLLEELHLDNRVVDPKEDVVITSIDYNQPNQILNRLRKSSFDYLDSILEK